MKTLIILALFIGMFFVIQGVYEQQLKEATQNKKTEVKFIPRTLYDEQMMGKESTFTQMFDEKSNSPWFERENL